jgi:hypothetical protein
MAEIFAAEAEGPGASLPKELSKNRLCGECCSKELHIPWSCKGQDRLCTGVASKDRGHGSVKRAIKKVKGKVNEVRELPEWERARAQIDSGASDAVGPKEIAKEIAKAFEMKETETSKSGKGYVAAIGRSVEN